MAKPEKNIQSEPPKPQLEQGTYELIQQRLRSQGDELRMRLAKLNTSRKEVFGAVEFALLANDRITTDNNCISQDMVALGEKFLFGYNVHMGLRSEVKLQDVFSVYTYKKDDHSFHKESLDLIESGQFEEDFHNLYKYYKETVFSKFSIIGPHLFMVFQVGKNVSDIKTFKWAIQDDGLIYIGNRFDHEYRYADQHEFAWRRTNRDMHRRGTHPHISIEERVFVETVGGDLTIKIEDNTDSGLGVYTELVDHAEQTLDDAEFYYADLGNLIILKIRPYQEKAFRYIIFNEKMQEALRVDSIEESCVLLPDNQGLIFSNGYYLQSGEYKIFDSLIRHLQFEKRISAPNGEDFLYIFYHAEKGLYVLLHYNLVEQKVDTPITCTGYSLFPNGELCYFRSEDSPSKHHVVQVWQSPYAQNETIGQKDQSGYLFKVGNKDIVRGMAECNELLALLDKGDSYGGLYIDLVKKSSDVLDSYYWIGNVETFNLAEPLGDLRETANSAIDEFEKVRTIKANSHQAVEESKAEMKALFDKIKRYKAQDIAKFVDYLAALRMLRGKMISLKALRYVDLEEIASFEQDITEKNQTIAEACVDFLLKPEALSPYVEKVQVEESKLVDITKVTEADASGEAISGIGKELELLIETVSNLNIADATETTRIIDNISQIYAHLNQLRAQLKNKRKDLLGTEATAEFHAQLNLLGQGIVNYLDLCDSPEACDTYLTKLMVQVEELEGKFSEFDEFLTQLTEKREEIYTAFESRKLSLKEARARRAQSLVNAAERILKGIQNRANNFTEIEAINAYFAADLMIEKVRENIKLLTELKETVKADDIQARLKTVQEDAIRQLKDKSDLFVEGENVIKLGRHHFSTNVQALDLTMVEKEGDMFIHLNGTNFFEKVEEVEFQETAPVWKQHVPSENEHIYRAEYLAHLFLKTHPQQDLKTLEKSFREFMAGRFEDAYVKGIHDQDGLKIYRALRDIESEIGLLHYLPQARVLGAFWWKYFLPQAEKEVLLHRLKGAGVILQLFKGEKEFQDLIADLENGLADFVAHEKLFGPKDVKPAALYLFHQLTHEEHFVISEKAAKAFKAFSAYLKKHAFSKKFQDSLNILGDSGAEKFELCRNWAKVFSSKQDDTDGLYIDELALCLFEGKVDGKRVKAVELKRELTGMLGEHTMINEGSYVLNYHGLRQRIHVFEEETLPLYRAFLSQKKTLLSQYTESLRLEEFKPRVLTSFVRNKLIDELYLPLVGDNLAKQMGTVGEGTRTDRMGMLLLISPPGYGKTTLMEYIANRLGLIFMKINGPAIGHEVTSLDPAAAPNAAAREELQKLNLALEMGDNVMLYVDDIQHCHPEFLQKFISLCDAQRKIEGVYKGRTRTYDLRGRKVAVVMAGNPYTESGDKFRIPDMLANRADTYNLGDIIGDSEEIFRLSYIENSLTSNPILAKLATKSKKDIHSIIQSAERGSKEGLDLEANISAEELEEYINVLEKLLKIRDVILNVNLHYIQSAAQEDAYRTEPVFQLQGSYRNMNKLAEKVLPIMNAKELDTLILSHYEGEAQTLTSGAEANLLKFKIMNGFANKKDTSRWEEIKEIFIQHKRLSSDRLGQLVAEMGAFSEGLSGIKEVLEKFANGENGK